MVHDVKGFSEVDKQGTNRASLNKDFYGILRLLRAWWTCPDDSQTGSR